MKQKIHSSEITGVVSAPASKSVAQRAVAIASLAEGISEIVLPGSSEDVLAAINVCRTLGADIHETPEKLSIKGNISLPSEPLDCGESGLSIRMFSAIAATLPGKVLLTGRNSLNNRPMDIIEQSLRAAGVVCKTNNGFLPVMVHGPLPGGVISIDGSVSSQILTGLLIAAPHALMPLTIKVKDIKSKPYIDVTINVMKFFGVEAENKNYEEFFIPSPQFYIPRQFLVEGDWSGAAFLLVGGSIAGEITVENLDNQSKQADKAIIQVLHDCGAHVLQEKNKVSVRKNRLKPFNFDATHSPDLFPPLVALASACEGVSEIYGVSRLRIKESDRALTLKQEFGKLGVRIDLENDKMKIRGEANLKGSIVNSHNDHRIAMACSVAALLSKEPVIIEDAQAVAKSYPEFFEDLRKIGANILEI